LKKNRFDGTLTDPGPENQHSLDLHSLYLYQIVPFIFTHHILGQLHQYFFQAFSPGLNFTNLMAQSANAPAVSVLPRLVSPKTYAQLYYYAQLEITLNFYAVRFTPCTSKTGINLLAQKLPVEH
jgi:hypothetical protein